MNVPIKEESPQPEEERKAGDGQDVQPDTSSHKETEVNVIEDAKKEIEEADEVRGFHFRLPVISIDEMV